MRRKGKRRTKIDDKFIDVHCPRGTFQPTSLKNIDVTKVDTDEV